MFLTRHEIERNIDWLLANASDAVKYLTHKHLLQTDPGSEAMQALWSRVAQGPEAAELLSKQHEDGSWFSGGPWGPQGYRRQALPGYTASRPKFVTTAWLLPYLGEMGFTVGDPRIHHGADYLMANTDLPDPVIDEGGVTSNCCGLYATPLRAFASIGMASDPRLEGRWDRLLRCQREDGGWLNPNHLADSPTPSTTQGRWPWDRSCAWGTYYATEALWHSHIPEYQEALQRAIGFLLWHLSQKDPAEIQTWVYHGHNMVKELLMTSEAGIDMTTPPVQALLTWLRRYYKPEEAVFRTQEKPIGSFTRHVSAIVKDYEATLGSGYWDSVAKVSAPVLRYHLYHLVEDDWLTYYLTQIAVNAQCS